MRRVQPVDTVESVQVAYNGEGRRLWRPVLRRWTRNESGRSKSKSAAAQEHGQLSKRSLHHHHVVSTSRCLSIYGTSTSMDKIPDG